MAGYHKAGRVAAGALGALALGLSTGCIHLVRNDTWGSGEVIGVTKPAPDPAPSAATVWQGKGDPWKDPAKPAGAVIGGDSAFEKGRGESVAGGSSRGTAGLEHELRDLDARVDRLERLVASGGVGTSASPARASAPARAPGRPVEIYKVDPTGQTAWIAAGTRRGMKEGQTLQVMRGGKAVAQARVARVWPDQSELTVLWANGKLQRGDSVVPR